MKLYCKRCGEKMDLGSTRIKGTYKYECYYCETIQKKAEMINEQTLLATNPKQFEPIYHCSSCDYPIWTMEQLEELDGCGRCQKCQDEYGEID